MKPIEEEWATDMLNCALGCFAVYLATGHTIYCKSIKASTLRLYLTAAADLIQKIDPVPRNAMNDNAGVTICKNYASSDPKQDHIHMYNAT